MSQPIAPAKGIAFAFPDVCMTPVPLALLPVPYPNVAQLDQATGITNIQDKELVVGSDRVHVLLKDSEIPTSSGDEAGSSGGVKSRKIKGRCIIISASQSVLYGPNKQGIARFMDQTQQNDENTYGVVLSAFPTVLVGD